MKKLTVTIEEAAIALGIGRNSAYAAAHTGEIPTIRVGKRFLVPLAALESMLSAPDRNTAAEKRKE
jgi:excisionase family DNA binding protein